jgi:hypothetical protein
MYINPTHMKRLLVGALALVIIALGAFALFYSPQKTADTTGPSRGDEEEVHVADIFASENPASLSATLTAVDGSNSSGTAYRLSENGMLYHSVTATMPDPAAGNSYEGWLVQPTPLDFFSTGIMEKNAQGQWQLVYSAEETYPSHLRVVITEETIIDATPEEHIIEGDF